MTVTRWWWIRHAPVTETGGRIYGSTDPKADVDHPHAYGALHEILPEDAVWVTSHLTRTKQTAAAIAEAGGRRIAPLEEPDLGEQNFGAWHGLTYDEVNAFADSHRFWLAPASHRPPEGESFADLTIRVSRVIHRLTDENAGRDIVAVAHGGTIRAALGVALELEPEDALKFATDNLSLTRLDHHAASGGHDAVWRVTWMNRPPIVEIESGQPA
jgi:alpha-ribazole phosphatase